MNQTPKQDLRFIKNEREIRKIFREMMAETDYSHITIKELTARAQINRKTFYLHYPSLDHLLASLQFEIMDPTFRMISETTFPDDVEKIIQHSFRLMAALDPVDKKILSAKGHFLDKKTPSDLIREHYFRKYDHFAGYDRFESNMIITYFSVCLGVIYRQWEVDGQRVPLEEMVPLATRLILHGLSGTRLDIPEAADNSPQTS
ncbi:MAG: TetR/AcrR family transcriptional regulator [Clostridiales bacterium]|uniref:TetR/AcrR family transcriptional regulator n=1 Tax=Candidatus Pullilachnospira stercoravium TaxID=2840913 RepID=A0A9D1NU78_9FIRM|nr:TetR/AcrR family transcriptional regulator [Clostridiales bacterium]HIV12900.1 TetR/AcrR family transcriptional regulator [Candidatus Pullilachnospira stercoravium]